MGLRDYDDYLQQVVKLVKNTPMVFYVIGTDWKFKLSEGAGLSKLGLEPGQVVGMNVDDVYGGIQS